MPFAKSGYGYGYGWGQNSFGADHRSTDFDDHPSPPPGSPQPILRTVDAPFRRIPPPTISSPPLPLLPSLCSSQEIAEQGCCPHQRPIPVKRGDGVTFAQLLFEKSASAIPPLNPQIPRNKKSRGIFLTIPKYPKQRHVFCYAAFFLKWNFLHFSPLFPAPLSNNQTNIDFYKSVVAPTCFFLGAPESLVCFSRP